MQVTEDYMWKLLLVLAMLVPLGVCAQVPHRTGSVHAAEADLGYEVFGEPGLAKDGAKPSMDKAKTRAAQ
jgi:hypothetical protein